MTRVAPSILAADFARLGEEVKAVTEAGADFIHVDVMDGHFVPNLSMGPVVVEAIKPHTNLPLDVHLMIAPADPFLESFAKAGADIITIHPEAGPHLHRSLQTIKSLGCKAGVSLNPATRISELDHVMDIVDLILIMTVNPGFGGQSFIDLSDKIADVRKKIKNSGRGIMLEIDGGVTAQTAEICRKAGADVLVAGTAVFKASNYKQAIDAIRGKMSVLASQSGWIGSILTDTASKVAISLDNWTNPVPARLLLSPPDLWYGEAEAGRHICAGRFVIGDQQFQAAQGDVWSSMDVLPQVWRDHVLSFDFLSHLRACGADMSRREARHHIARFFEKQAGRMDHFPPEITARRFIQWLVHFDFYGSSADYQFQLEVRRSLGHQLRHLTKREAEAGLPRLAQAVALVIGGVALEGQTAAFTLGRMWLDDCLRNFVKDNGVATRRPSDAIEALTLLLTLRCTLLQTGLAVPESVKRGVDELSSCLRFLRGADKKLPVFQGGVSGNVARTEQLLKRADSKTRVSGAAAMGYQKMVSGRTQIFMDCGSLPSVDHDERAHAAPLAFEMWVGRDRVFTQCGVSPFLSETAGRALRGTLAHSTLSIDDRNVCEIRAKGGLGRRYSAPHFQRWELDGGVMIDAWHSGYQDLFGLTHRRKMALLEDGECLAGEDEVSSEAELIRPHYVTLRFHLHPRVQASLIQNDTEVLLRLPGSGGWRFSTDGGKVALEESLYCGSGRPKPTQCITVTRQMTEPSMSIAWAVQAELPS